MSERDKSFAKDFAGNKCSTQVEVHRETNMNSHRRKEQQQIMQTSVYSRLTEVVWSGDNEGKWWKENNNRGGCVYTGWSGSSSSLYICMYYKCLDTASDFGVHSSCHTEDRSLNRSQRTAAKSRTATATAGVVANASWEMRKGAQLPFEVKCLECKKSRHDMWLLSTHDTHIASRSCGTRQDRT